MNLPFIFIPKSYTILSFIIAFIIIMLAIIFIIKDIYKYPNKDRSAVTIGISTVFIFAIHLIGYTTFYSFYTNITATIILVVLVGTPYAIISMSIVLLKEALFLGNGSIHTLGINIIIIAFMGSIITLFMKKKYFDLNNIKNKELDSRVFFGFLMVSLAAFFSVHIIGLSTALFIGITKTIPVQRLMLEMIETQMSFAVIEAIVTFIFLFIFSFIDNKERNRVLIISSITIMLISLLLKTHPNITDVFLENYHIEYLFSKSVSNIFHIPRIVYLLIAKILIFILVFSINHAINYAKKILNKNN